MVSVASFGVRNSVMFHLMFIHYTFSSVWVAEWPPFLEIAAHSVGHLFTLSFVYLLYLFISRFGFMSGIWLLIAPVPVHCFSLHLFRAFKSSTGLHTIAKLRNIHSIRGTTWNIDIQKGKITI